MPFVPDSSDEKPLSGFVPDKPPALGDAKTLNEFRKSVGLHVPQDGSTSGDIEPQMLMPGGAGPAVAKGIKGLLTGVGSDAALGGIAGAAKTPQGDETHLGNAGEGATIGGLASVGMRVTGAGIGKLSDLGGYVGRNLARMSKPQAAEYTSNPSAVGKIAEMLDDQSQTPALEKQAADAINSSRKALRTKGLQTASSLSELLGDKTVRVNPRDYLGVDPDTTATIMGKVGDGLEGYAKNSPHANMPATVDLEANTANDIKRRLQDASKFKPGVVMDPNQAARNESMAAKARDLKTSIESVGGSGVKDLNSSMQEGSLTSSDLRKGLKNPLAFVSSEAPGRIATMARASSPGSDGVLDFGNKLGAAKQMLAKDVGSGIPTFTGRAAGRALMRASKGVSDSTEKLTPAIPPALLQGLFNKEK